MPRALISGNVYGLWKMSGEEKIDWMEVVSHERIAELVVTCLRNLLGWSATRSCTPGHGRLSAADSISGTRKSRIGSVYANGIHSRPVTFATRAVSQLVSIHHRSLVLPDL